MNAGAIGYRIGYFLADLLMGLIIFAACFGLTRLLFGRNWQAVYAISTAAGALALLAFGLRSIQHLDEAAGAAAMVVSFSIWRYQRIVKAK